jgi:hypothetical protein
MDSLLANWKEMAALAAACISLISYFPYVTAILSGRIRPHAYTWLIWSITQGTATVGLFLGDGGFAVIGFALSALFNVIIFFLCFTHGTKKIDPSDGIILLIALAAIVGWWQLKDATLAILMVTAIDAIGYEPTYRKLLDDPRSESLLSWLLFTLAFTLYLASLKEYNWLTLPYIVMTLIANSVLICLIIFVRRKHKKQRRYPMFGSTSAS